MTANTYIFTVIDPVSSGTVTTVAINDAGEVAGSYIDAASATHGFTDIGGTISTIDAAGAATTEITAVNAGGIVAGFSFATASQTATNAVGFTGLPGSTISIAVPGTDIEPTAVNAGGEVVGTAGTSAFTQTGGAFATLSVTSATATSAVAVNAGGEVAGDYIDANFVQHGFTDSAGVIATIDPAGSVLTTVAGVNASGEVAGSYNDGVNELGFTDVNGVIRTISAPGSVATIVTGLNDAGTVVGYDLLSAGGQQGFIDLGGQLDSFALSGGATQPDAINDAGQIAGTVTNAAGVTQAFVAAVTPNYVFGSPAPTASSTVVNAAGNNGGEVVGTTTNGSGVDLGFIDKAGVITTFQDTGATSTDITAVNAGGTLTGFSSAGAGANGQWFTVTSDGVVTDHADDGDSITPTAINAGGEVVGDDGLNGFFAVGGALTVLSAPGATGTLVSAVNDAGEIVGNYTDASGVQHGFTDIGGVFATIDPAGSTSTEVAGVNNGGEIAGTYIDSSGVTDGFTETGGVFTTLQAPGALSTVVEAVNDAGTVTGFYLGSDVQQHGFVDLGGVISTLDPPGSTGAMPTGVNSAGEVFGTDRNAAGLETAFTATPACYCPGTLIRTAQGDVAVEDLAIGMRVVTVDGLCKPVRWIGRRSYAGRFLRARPALLPVRILAGALAAGIPSRDLIVSPAHALLLDGVLVPAGELVNGVTILRELSAGQIDYIHIELAEHDVIWANDAAAETFLDDDSRAMFSNAAEYASLYPDAPAGAAGFCAPRIVSGPTLERLRLAHLRVDQAA